MKQTIKPVMMIAFLSVIIVISITSVSAGILKQIVPDQEDEWREFEDSDSGFGYQGYFAGYPGITSWFYDTSVDEKVLGFLDSELWYLFGGVDYGTAALCKQRISRSVDNGASFSIFDYGTYAHVEAERIAYYNYSINPADLIYLYKISFEVNPADCQEMKWNVFISGPDEPRTALFTSYFDQDSNQTSFAGNTMIIDTSRKYFDEICMHFRKLSFGCLVDLSEGDNLCNGIANGGERDVGSPEGSWLSSGGGTESSPEKTEEGEPEYQGFD